MPGTIGNTYIDRLIGEYVPVEETNSLAEELLADETNQLLFATVQELRAQRFQDGTYDIQEVLRQERDAEGSGVDVDATYDSRIVDAPQFDNGDDWETIDLDFATSEIDLRFDDDIYVAFKQEFGSDDVIPYPVGDSPVVGIPASTSWIQVVAQEGTGGATINVESWGDN